MKGEDVGGLRGWLVPVLLVVLIVVALGFVGMQLAFKAGDGGFSDRVDALREHPADSAANRAEVRQLAEKFVVAFHTYGPDDLENGELTGYPARVTPLQTAKFKATFEAQATLPQETVARLRAKSTAEAQAAGVVTIDADSAEVLVGGWSQQSYRSPTDKKKRIESEQQPFRYRVSIVKTGGKWLVDDLDEIGDDLPGFAEQTSPAVEPGTPGATDPQGGAGGGSPTAPGASPTEDAS